jgi:hypothetical protein
MFALLFAAALAHGQDAEREQTDEQQASDQQITEQQATDEEANDELAAEDQGDGIKSPKTMSGMSILGNEEAPKSLVIIPWKSSELGDTISFSDTLDELARPVDKEVFLRELSFFAIRSGK